MFEIKEISYEEARREYLEEQMQKAQRSVKYWESRIDRSRPDNLMDIAHLNAADAGWKYNFYKDALEALENQPKWISVEERLPEKSGCYLVAINCPKGRWSECNSYDHLEKRWSSEWDCFHEDTTELVTHYMPLPEAPKEEA